MIKKMLLIFFMFICIYCYTQETNNTENKDLKKNNVNAITDSTSDKNEFSIGGGAKTLVGYEYYDDNSFYKDTFPGTFIFGINLPISYVYYVNEKIGLGINYKIGFSYTMESLIKKLSSESITFNNFFMDNSLSFVNKFGNSFSKKYLLIEYGILFSLLSMINFKDYTDNTLFLTLGPTLFIGSEKRYSSNFIYTIGGFIDTRFYLNPAINIINYKCFIIGTGIEFRWKYYYKK